MIFKEGDSPTPVSWGAGGGGNGLNESLGSNCKASLLKRVWFLSVFAVASAVAALCVTLWFNAAHHTLVSFSSTLMERFPGLERDLVLILSPTEP